MNDIDSMGAGPVVGYCRACGKPLHEETAKAAQGTIFCAEHVPVTLLGNTPAPGSGYSGGYQGNAASGFAPPPPLPGTSPRTGAQASPPLAFILGFIPGVGAVYNGQYAKGLVHVLILGSIISVLANDAAPGFEPLFGFLIPCFFFYMAFEAYHTAKLRMEGQTVDEFSSILPIRPAARFPMLAIILIAFGVLFLLSNLGLLEFHRILRYWPVLLILLGLYMLFERMVGHSSSLTNDAPTNASPTNSANYQAGGER